MSAVLECDAGLSVLHVGGALLAPLQRDLARSVEALLDRGERCLMVDLGSVSDIDAAGVGELVRAYTRTSEAGGVLRIAHARGRVRTVLGITGVWPRLSAQPSHG